MSKKIIITTPVGKMKWFKAVKADEKFQKYSVDLILEDSEEVQKLINKVDELLEETLKIEQQKHKESGNKTFKKFNKKDNPIQEILDEDGNPTGSYRMKPTKDSIFKKENKVIAGPPILSPAARVLTTEEKSKLRVNNGSLGRLSVHLSPYVFQGKDVGVSLKLQAVQIIELASREDSMNNDAISGFSSEGDDFSFDESEAGDFSTSEATNSDDF